MIIRGSGSLSAGRRLGWGPPPGLRFAVAVVVSAYRRMLSYQYRHHRFAHDDAECAGQGRGPERAGPPHRRPGAGAQFTIIVNNSDDNISDDNISDDNISDDNKSAGPPHRRPGAGAHRVISYNTYNTAIILI